MTGPLTVFVTLTLADARHWPALAERATSLGCAAAVLQGDGPGLTHQLDALAEAGHESVLLAPVTLGETGVPASWVGRVARWWLERHPDATMRVLISGTVLRALPDEPASVAGARTLRPNGETLTNPTWADPPPVHTHLLICRGPGAAPREPRRPAESWRRSCTAAGCSTATSWSPTPDACSRATGPPWWRCSRR
ncbi:MAG: hypothetical protein R2719_11180 [Micropruina sp.]